MSDISFNWNPNFSLKLYRYSDLKDSSQKVRFTKEFIVSFLEFLCGHKKEIIKALADFYINQEPSEDYGHTIQEMLESKVFDEKIRGGFFKSYFESQAAFLIDLNRYDFDQSEKDYKEIKAYTLMGFGQACCYAKELYDEKHSFDSDEKNEFLKELASLKWENTYEIVEFKKRGLFVKGYLKMRFKKPQLAVELDNAINQLLSETNYRVVSFATEGSSDGESESDVITQIKFVKPESEKDLYLSFHYDNKSLKLSNIGEYGINENKLLCDYILAKFDKNEFVFEDTKSKLKDTNFSARNLMINIDEYLGFVRVK